MHWTATVLLWTLSCLEMSLKTHRTFCHFPSICNERNERKKIYAAYATNAALTQAT